MTMKSIARFVVPVLFLVLFFALGSGNVAAQGRHPAYLHALSDLRAARAHLERHDGGELRHEEKEAIHAIDNAINEIKKASTDDGKDLNDHPPVDAGLDYTGRLRRANEEDNTFAQGLQQRAFGHIDKAIHEVNESIRVVAARS